jgi:DNA-binding winged helix-turn-helix (wHTH) protein
MTAPGEASACPCCGAPIDPNTIVLDDATGIISHGGREAYLGPNEAAMVRALLDAFPRVVSREALYDRAYSLLPECDQPMPKIIDVMMCKVRAKLDPLGVRITTKWGRGYAINEDQPQAAQPDGEKQIRGKRMEWDKSLDAKVADLFARGYSLTSIARTIGQSYSATDRAMRRLSLYRAQASA